MFFLLASLTFRKYTQPETSSRLSCFNCFVCFDLSQYTVVLSPQSDCKRGRGGQMEKAKAFWIDILHHVSGSPPPTHTHTRTHARGSGGWWWWRCVGEYETNQTKYVWITTVPFIVSSQQETASQGPARKQTLFVK